MTIAREDLLLLLLARARRDEAAAARTRSLLAGRLDWGILVESAIRHGVAPLVHDTLERDGAALGAASVPAPVRSRLAELASISARRNDRLLATTGEAVDALAAAGVRALGLKELGLGSQVYAAPGLRPMGDVDILVDRDRFAAAAAALEQLGYRTLPRAEIPFTRRYAWAHHMRRPADNVWIDLQWNVMQRQWLDDERERFVFRPQALWDGAPTITLPGGSSPLYVPAPEPMLLHLCGHLEGHQYGELVLFADIDQALHRWEDGVDWTRLAALAERFGMRGTVGHVLDACGRLLGTPIPASARGLFGGAAFRGPLYDAMFSGLGPLHLALDDIVDAAHPPRPVVDRLELAVRAQAARSAAVYERVDAVIAGCENAGVRPVCDGRPAGRVFPEPGPGAAPRARLVVAESDRAALDAALEAAGFSRSGAAGWRATIATAGDAERALPPLRSFPVDVGVHRGLAALLAAGGAGELSNRSAAIALIGRRLRRRPEAGDPRGTVDVVVVDRHELLVWLLCRLGGADAHALYLLPDIIDLVEVPADPAEAPAAAAIAQACGVTGDVRRGLAIACALIPEDAGLQRLHDLLGDPVGDVHPLQWAREGPASLVRFSDLRRPFLLTLALLAASGARELVAALRSAGRRAGGEPSPASRALSDLRTALRRARSRRAGADPPEIVYWLEP